MNIEIIGFILIIVLIILVTGIMSYVALKMIDGDFILIKEQKQSKINRLKKVLSKFDDNYILGFTIEHSDIIDIYYYQGKFRFIDDDNILSLETVENLIRDLEV